MVKRAAVSELKANLSQFLREVEVAGERVIVERRGRPIAVLAPHVVEALEVHWADELDGLAADIDDFLSVMDEVVDSRAASGSRPVDLDA